MDITERLYDPPSGVRQLTKRITHITTVRKHALDLARLVLEPGYGFRYVRKKPPEGEEEKRAAYLNVTMLEIMKTLGYSYIAYSTIEKLL